MEKEKIKWDTVSRIFLITPFLSAYFGFEFRLYILPKMFKSPQNPLEKRQRHLIVIILTLRSFPFPIEKRLDPFIKPLWSYLARPRWFEHLTDSFEDYCSIQAELWAHEEALASNLS